MRHARPRAPVGGGEPPSAIIAAPYATGSCITTSPHAAVTGNRWRREVHECSARMPSSARSTRHNPTRQVIGGGGNVSAPLLPPSSTK